MSVVREEIGWIVSKTNVFDEFYCSAFNRVFNECGISENNIMGISSSIARSFNSLVISPNRNVHSIM